MYFKKTTILSIVFFLSIFTLISQEKYIEYKGKVIDSKTNKGLESVSITVLNSNISTVTNADGTYILKVPDGFKNSKVQYTLLGYYSTTLALSLLEKQNAKIVLKQAATTLAEVTISTYKEASDIVREVFKRKSKTVHNQPVYMTAFYRETIKKRRRNVSLTEAVVNILKQPYTTSVKDALQLNKARKRTDYKRLDTLSLKLQGGPFSTLYLDIMKYPEYIFSDESIATFEFTYEPSTTINNNSVYVINFKPKYNTQNYNYNGKLYIDVNTLALVSAKYSLDLSDEKKSRNLLVKKKPRQIEVYPLLANYKVDYKEKNGRWYYSYSNLNLKFKVNKKRKWFNKTYSLSSEMAVTDWDINTNIKQISAKDRLSPNIIITDAITGFSNPDFWGEYNLIEPDKSIESAIKKIRKNMKSQTLR